MRDIELYRAILGLTPPWTVSGVDLDSEKQEVVITVEVPGSTFLCPECQRECPGYDCRLRRWRHLDTCQFRTFIEAEIPRVQCATHGVKQIRIPWAEPGAQFTALFERFGIDLLRACSVKRAAEILRISWDEAWGLMARAVKRGQAGKGQKRVTKIGVDEKAVAKGHRYLTLVCDLEKATVEYIGEDRKQASLEAYYAGLTAKQREGIEAVAMDMWEPYIQATEAQIAEASKKIVFDRFHIMGHMGKAVDTVRKREHRERILAGDKTLTGTKYLWLYAQENLPEPRLAEFEELVALNLKVGRAWALKESLRELWNQPTASRAKRFWMRWFWWATHSRLEPVRQVAHLLKRHWANILTYFHHRITNAVSEGLNSKIQTIKKMAYGFRNKDHFKTAIFFHCGGLDLYPH